jgi:hypothetical protein
MCTIPMPFLKGQPFHALYHMFLSLATLKKFIIFFSTRSRHVHSLTPATPPAAHSYPRPLTPFAPTAQRSALARASIHPQSSSPRATPSPATAPARQEPHTPPHLQGRRTAPAKLASRRSARAPPFFPPARLFSNPALACRLTLACR